MQARLILLGLVVTAAALAAGDVKPPRVIRTVEPRYPDTLLQRGIYEGEAQVVILVDAAGRLADWLITGFTHPLFAREATEALQAWQFEPARRGGQPIDVRTAMVFMFRASGLIVNVSAVEALERFRTRNRGQSGSRLCRPDELDAPLTVLRQTRPLWPAGWEAPPGTEGRVTLDFYIDEQGRARMPVVVTSDHDALALPAVEALSHWEFERPTRGGAPVLVRATQVFRFRQR